MVLDRLTVPAGVYLREHGRRAVSAEVRRWVAHPASVRKCGEPMGGLVPVVWRSGRGTHLRSLVQCRNRFVDPYCSGWFRALLGQQIGAVVGAGLDEGRPAYLLVMTCRHKRGESLASVMDWQQRAWAKLCTWNGWRSMGVEWCRVWDIVVGGPNGPHPHANVVLLGPAGLGAEQFRGRVRQWWSRSLMLSRPGKGWRPTAASLERGAVLREVAAGDVERVSGYAARDVDGVGLEAADDRYRVPGSGFGLLELACMAHAGQDAAGALLGACAKDLAGRRSWTASKAWTARPEWRAEDLADDEADADALVAGGWWFGMILAKRYRQHRRAVDELLDCQAGGDLGLAEVVAQWQALDARLDGGLGLDVLAEPRCESELEPGPVAVGASDAAA